MAVDYNYYLAQTQTHSCEYLKVQYSSFCVEIDTNLQGVVLAQARLCGQNLNIVEALIHLT